MLSPSVRLRAEAPLACVAVLAAAAAAAAAAEHAGAL